nr:MAG TPA: hypothetical protein [Bacteriophage sp.]
MDSEQANKIHYILSYLKRHCNLANCNFLNK